MCKGIMGKIFGHKFESRYNIEKSASKPIGSMTNIWDIEKVLDQFRDTKKIYIYDICSRCGKIIKKDL